MRQFRWICTGFALAILMSLSARGAELPDSEINTLTGYVESVDAPSETAFKVRHIEDEGQGGSRTVTELSSDEAVSPRIAINEAGDSWVVWWSDTANDRVYARVHDQSAGTWGAQKTVSLATEQGRYPQVIHDSSSAWILYQSDTGSGTEIAVQSIIDSADPWPTRTIAATADATGDLDARIHAKADHLWITWIDDASYVGWTEFDYVSETWGASSYESYVGSDVETARNSIRATVLAP